MKRRFLLLLLVAVAVVASTSIFLLVSTFTFHNEDAIGFGASLNATTVTQSQTVRVYLADWNTLDFKNSLPLADGLRALNLSSGPCGNLSPTGIAVYEGAYDLSNISSASSLAFFSPGVYNCPLIFLNNPFTFAPLQNITTYVDLTGYWTAGSTAQPGGGSSQGVLHRFAPDIYTVIAGDDWGNTKVMYFHVNGITDDSERTGPVSSFPASWLNPCNQSATGNVTTMTYLGLNSSSDFDHINTNQVYEQIIDSSSFTYDSVGHGWVVTEWTEAAGSGGNGGDDQVVASFTLTSVGVPSSHILAFYDLVSGTVAVTFTANTATSCSDR